MEREPVSSAPEVKHLPSFDFDVSDPQGWFRHVADWIVLSGRSRRTGEAYARDVRILVARIGKPAHLIAESEVRDFMLERHSALGGSSRRIMYRGLSILFNEILKFDWELLRAARAKRDVVEPTILTRAEVAKLFGAATTQAIYTYLRTVYSCGLRMSEALHLRVGDIDRARGVLRVRRGKGSKDRSVILPAATLRMLGAYWKTHHNREWLFPALGQSGRGGPTAGAPMSIAAVQGAMLRTAKRAGITKSGVTLHTLRHSYATHLLEANVPLTVLQRQLGHTKIETTLRYVHLSRPAQVNAEAIVGELMRVIR
jgi:integrase